MFDLLTEEKIKELCASDVKMQVIKFIIESNEYSLSESRPDLDIRNNYVGDTHVDIVFKNSEGSSLQVVAKNLFK